MILNFRRSLVFLVVGAVILGMVLMGYSLAWTGFGTSIAPDGSVHPGKSLWDWLQLVLVPIVLFFLAQWYSTIQGKVERERQKIAEQYQSVQTYFDRIQTLILDNSLLQATPDDPTSSIARALTLTTLERIDGERKSAIIRFLDEMKLIQGIHQRTPIISLSGADMSNLGAPLGTVFSDFVGADLSFADLRQAKIDVGNFENANLKGADVSGASFIYCNFRGADFQVVGLQGVNLYEAIFDIETILPNGQHWNNTDMTKFGAVLIPPITDEEAREIRRELQYPEDGSN